MESMICVVLSGKKKRVTDILDSNKMNVGKTYSGSHTMVIIYIHIYMTDILDSNIMITTSQIKSMLVKLIEGHRHTFRGKILN